MLLSQEGEVHHFLVRVLAGGELEQRCDACIRRHSPVNPRCAMNLAITREYDNCFYDFRTRAPIKGVWRLVDSNWQNASVGLESWERVAPLAPTATQGQLV